MDIKKKNATVVKAVTSAIVKNKHVLLNRF